MSQDSVHRIEVFDFLRGVVIVDMFLVHYRESLQPLLGLWVVKFIDYSDVAMEGFLLLAGFMVGYHYLQRFGNDRKGVSRRLLGRAFKILKLHYIMICTISLPLALILGPVVTKGASIPVYLAKSFLFMNQVPLLHILPTFIPLFIMAIPILFLLDEGKERAVLFLSGTLFMIGNWNPYLFSLGERTIFPVILWQIYFVAGIVLGKRSIGREGEEGSMLRNGLSLGLGVFIVTAVIYFGHHLFPTFGDFKSGYGIQVSKFPLNLLGLLYRGALLLVICTSTTLAWKSISRWSRPVGLIKLFGRNSFVFFVIHVYFAEVLFVIISLTGNSFPLSQVIILSNLVFATIFLRYLEGHTVVRGVDPSSSVRLSPQSAPLLKENKY